MGRRQLRDLERQLRAEGRSAEWRPWHQERRARQAEMRREAGRRPALAEGKER